MQSINDVIKKLDDIILLSETNQSAIGYFAALYRRMTLAVKEGIEQDEFENGPRMERLDIVFAQRYFDALATYQQNKVPTKSWKKAFDAAKNNQISVIQHLILGINAHINLDLAIAASEISTKADIVALEKDFNKINNIISALIDDTKMRLSKIWWPFRIFTGLLDTESDGIVNFSIKIARGFSWQNAKNLTFETASQKNLMINQIDNSVTILSEKIINPSRFMSSILWMIRIGESGTVNDKIKILK
jgi:Family of unknown function (DUF5995)